MQKIRNSKGRTAVLASVFAATVAAGLTAATFGVTKEQSVDEACGRMAWPYISANCLDGVAHSTVRVVALDRTGVNAMAERFAAAFD